MSQLVKPAGHVPVPLILFGFLSLILGTAAEVIGAFRGPNDSLRDLCADLGLAVRAEMGLPGMVGIFITAAASFGLVAAILGTPGKGRRLILGFSALILVVALFPAFAVWGIFWKPFGVVLAVIWAWFSATIYSGMHVMPCESSEESVDKPVIRLDGDQMTQQHSRQTNG